MISDRPLFWTVSLLGFCFLLSLGLYFLFPGHLTRTVLTFPNEISHRPSPEARSLPFNWDQEHNVELLVREILLGPARHDHLRLFSREASVSSVLVRRGTIYVDLKKDSFIPDPDVLYFPVTALKVLKATLMDNFVGISDVKISVDGEPVGGNIVDKG
jgi:Sporulation and spore germination